MLEEKISIIGTVIEPSEDIDWHYWKQLPNVQLWTAAALACNINPFKISFCEGPPVYHALNTHLLTSEEGRLLNSAINICVSNLGLKIKPVKPPIVPSAQHTTIIDLMEFVLFAKESDWRCPNNFFAIYPISKPDTKTIEETDNVSDLRERKAYLRIIRALAEMAKLDISTEPYKAAESIEAQITHQGDKLSKNCIGDKLKEVKKLLPPKKPT